MQAVIKNDLGFNINLTNNENYNIFSFNNAVRYFIII